MGDGCHGFSVNKADRRRSFFRRVRRKKQDVCTLTGALRVCLSRCVTDMDAGSKLAELDLTREEVQRLSRAFRDERFRALLREYADEIADPENRRTYEQEITQLEQERGVDVTFVHPTPHRVLQTSADGKRKCFINVCANELVRKPEGARGRGSAGEPGCHWSLPYSLSRGREHVGAKGGVYTVYDVIFHPDTLRMAQKNERFMGLVDSVALRGVQSHFGVRLDENNVKVLKIKYKGVPNPSVIRKPMPGGAARAQEAHENDPLRFPYPYDAQPPGGAKSEAVWPDSGESGRSTEPRYALKYRSYVDLQDYTYARDSAPGPRPKEMVVTIDLPLLKSAADADLNVTERRLLLESQRPAYRLELPLPYPVDESKGQAKFSKPKGQLTVTLPVLPLRRPSTDEVQAPQLASDAGGRDGVDADEAEEGECEGEGCKHAGISEPSTTRDQSSTKPSDEEDTTARDPPKEQNSSSPRGEGSDDAAGGNGGGPGEEYLKCPNSNGSEEQAENTRRKHESWCDGKKSNEIVASEDSKDKEQAGATHQSMDTHVSDEVRPLSGTHGRERNSVDSLQVDEAAPCPKPEQTGGDGQDPLVLQDPLGPPGGVAHEDVDTPCAQPCASKSQEGRKLEEMGQDVGEPERCELDEDDLPSKHSSQRLDEKHTAVILREINPQNGQVEVISDHTTSAGISFDNSLLYELD